MSGALSCSANGCVNNVNGLCSANTIHVKGVSAHTSMGTECETFAEKSFKNAIMNMGNMNIGGEIRQLVNKNGISMSPQIQCNACNCVHNINKYCNANNVQINGYGAVTSEGTQCETFAD